MNFKLVINNLSKEDFSKDNLLILDKYLEKKIKNKKLNYKIQEYEKGEAGGDWIQEVIDQGVVINKILYERKS